MGSPKNCQSCRGIIAEFQDEKRRCRSCGAVIVVSAKNKFRIHRGEGPYTPPDECRQCERGERPLKRQGDFPDRRKVLRPKYQPQYKGGTDFDRIAAGNPVQPRIIVTDPSMYQQQFPAGNETRLEHLLRHMASSAHSQVNGRSGKSPSTFDDGLVTRTPHP